MNRPLQRTQFKRVKRQVFRVGMFSVMVATAVSAEEPKKSEEKKPEPPKLLLSLPPAIPTGSTNTLVLRGLNLTNVSDLRFTNEIPGATIVVTSTGKSEVPKDYEAKRIGDTQLEARIFIPNAWPVLSPPNWLVATSPAGVSEAFPLLLLPAGTVAAETEPNGGFSQAQSVAGRFRFILGAIKEAGDVDVFRVALRANEQLKVSTYAAPGGSTLDSLVTLYDEAGRFLTANDDIGATRDSQVEFTAKRDGTVSVVLQDANDRGGLTHVYVLRLTVTER